MRPRRVEAARTARSAVAATADRTARRSENAERLAGLSAREHEVLTASWRGSPTRRSPADLEISPRTVEAYRANLMMKMGADSLSELVRITLTARATD